MIDFDELLLSRFREILGIIAEGGVSHREVSSVARHVQADYHGRFLVELLQNANDQVVKAGQKDGIVEIFRTHDALAVTNGGLPFDDPGIRTLTSLGLSEKDPNTLIGNKGIGFKAVFEVSVSPEIYSIASAGASLADPDATAFKISQTPFDGLEGKARLRELAERALIDRGSETNRLLGDPVETLMSAVLAAAPFKFPTRIQCDERINWLTSLNFDPTKISTLVVLPLKQDLQDDRTEMSVNRALDEILESRGSFILFLPGISEIRIIDSVRDQKVTLRKSIENVPEELPDGVIYSVRRLTVEEGDEPASTLWHVVESITGGAMHPEVAQALQDAAKDLPGDGQSEVSQAPVAVALPFCRAEGDSLSLGANGKFCIGLPTKVATGTPAWIHSHFFGKISRQDLDLDYRFNEILFQEAVRLHEILINRLKRDHLLEARRLATLAFEKNDGPLSKHLFRKDGEASGNVILAEDGETFACPAEVLVPKPKWAVVTSQILASCPKEVLALPVIPHESLVIHAQELISSLTYGSSNTKNEVFFAKGKDDKCPLEYAAEANRLAGTSFWNAFLEFSLDLAGSDCLEKLGRLRILPVGYDRVAASADNVFLQPGGKVETKESSEPTKSAREDESEGEEIERAILSTLPNDVFSRLNFLDETCIQARLENGRSLTTLALRLSPDKGVGLIHRPGRLEMIQRAIVPAFQVLGNTPTDLAYGLQLLKIAGQWMRDVSEENVLSIQRQMVVPVLIEDQNWEWRDARTTYFGTGWRCHNEQQILSAYGTTTGCLLIPFQWVTDSGSSDSQDEWRGIMANLGVNSRPRVLVSSRRGVAQFRAEHSGVLGLLDESRCPIDQGSRFWNAYLLDCCGRVTNVGSRQPYRLSEVSWIDGLEREESRGAIVEMVLKDHQYYANHSRVRIGREYSPETMDSSEHSSLWTFAIRHEDWACIPTDGGVRRPSECWIIGNRVDSNYQGRFGYLERIRKDIIPARSLLKELGVPDIQSPDANSVIRELSRCAGKLVGVLPEQRLMHYLVEDLYGHLLSALIQEGAAGMPVLSADPMPLFCGGRLVAMPLSEIKNAYIVDDLERAAFLPELDNALIWPLPPKRRSRSNASIVEWLRRSLGEGAAILVSEMNIQTGFESMGKISLFRDWLRETGFQDPAGIMVDVGCLLCMSSSMVAPGGEAFNQSWARFEQLQIVYGTFPSDARLKTFLDNSSEGGPILQVGSSLDRYSVLKELWQLIGEESRDLFAAYVNALQNNVADAFFKFRRFSGKDREDVEVSVESVTGGQLESIKSAIYAYRLENYQESVEEFLRGWEANGDSWEKFVNWLREPFTSETLRGALVKGGLEARSIAILRLGGIDVTVWQNARIALGLEPHHFSQCHQLWCQVRKQVAAILKAAMARRSGSDLVSSRSIIKQVEELEAPEAVLCAEPDIVKVLSGILLGAEQLLQDDAIKNRLTFLRLFSVLLNIRDLRIPSDIRVGEDAPLRDVSEYCEVGEDERGRRATEWCMAYLKIVGHLTQQVGNFGHYASDSELAVVINGYWANRFSMIPILQTVLEKVAPVTLQEMKERRAFHNPTDLRKLFSLFPELESRERVQPTPKLPQKIEVLGVSVEPEAILEDLTKDGPLAQALMASVEQEAFDPKVDVVREFVDELKGGGGRSGSSRSKPSQAHESEERKTLTGQIGEFYIYRWLQKLDLPNFDQECWISLNRCPFVGCENGDDLAGFDFMIKDEGGKLTQRSDEPNVLIEVKSTGCGDDGQFFLSSREWRRAVEAHKADGEEYWIVIVEHALNSPRIAQIVKDPYKLMIESRLRFKEDSLIVKVGSQIPYEP